MERKRILTTDQITCILIDHVCASRGEDECTHKISILLDTNEHLFVGSVYGGELVRLMAATKAQTIGITSIDHFKPVMTERENNHINKEPIVLDTAVVTYESRLRPRKINKMVRIRFGEGTIIH